MARGRKKKEAAGGTTQFKDRLKLLLDGREDDPNFPRKKKGEGMELAAYLGLDRQSITQYKKGDAEPTLYNLMRIAEKYNVSVDWLLGILPENCSGRDFDEKEAAKYTGLSYESVIALHRISYGTDKHFAPDTQGKQFLDMALETCLEDSLPSDECIEAKAIVHFKKLDPEIKDDLIVQGITRKPYKTAFSYFYENVFPSVNAKSQVTVPSGKDEKIKDLLTYLNSKNISRFYASLRKRYKRKDQEPPVQYFVLEELGSEEDEDEVEE